MLSANRSKFLQSKRTNNNNNNNLTKRYGAILSPYNVVPSTHEQNIRKYKLAGQHINNVASRSVRSTTNFIKNCELNTTEFESVKFISNI